MIDHMLRELPPDVEFFEYGGGQSIIPQPEGRATVASAMEAQLIRLSEGKIVDREIIRIEYQPINMPQSQLVELFSDKIRKALANIEARR